LQTRRRGVGVGKRKARWGSKGLREQTKIGAPFHKKKRERNGKQTRKQETKFLNLAKDFHTQKQKMSTEVGREKETN